VANRSLKICNHSFFFVNIWKVTPLFWGVIFFGGFFELGIRECKELRMHWLNFFQQFPLWLFELEFIGF
jgi:hypothetical protein